MSDTAPRNPVGIPRLLADALLRSVAGTSAMLHMTPECTDTSQLELGLAASIFSDVVVSPVVMRKLRPALQEGGEAKWELLVSATSVEKQIGTLNLESAQALFAMTMAITVGGQDYLIESISSNEAFGQVYLYRLLLREARQQAM